MAIYGEGTGLAILERFPTLTISPSFISISLRMGQLKRLNGMFLLIEEQDAHRLPINKEALQAAELMEHLASRFAKWQLPDETIITQELPKTSVGKLANRVLKQFGGQYI